MLFKDIVSNLKPEQEVCITLAKNAYIFVSSGDGFRWCGPWDYLGKAKHFDVPPYDYLDREVIAFYGLNTPVVHVFLPGNSAWENYFSS